jgi:hypothetical protein
VGKLHGMSAGEGHHLWSGLVSFDEDGFADRSQFSDITRKVRPKRGRKGLTGGRLQMRSDGLHWKAGSMLTPGGQLHEPSFLPCSVIPSMEANRIPYELPIGGALLMHLQGGPHLYGEFLGSRSRLLDAINRLTRSYNVSSTAVLPFGFRHARHVTRASFGGRGGWFAPVRSGG